jgi:hypothetical protein
LSSASDSSGSKHSRAIWMSRSARVWSRRVIGVLDALRALQLSRCNPVCLTTTCGPSGKRWVRARPGAGQTVSKNGVP